MNLYSIYDRHYKKFLLFSVAILLACIGIVIAHYAQTGELFERSVSLKGGITITAQLPSSINYHGVESALKERFPQGDISARELGSGDDRSILIEAGDVSLDELTAELPKLGVPLGEGEYSVENMGSALGSRFLTQTMTALLFAFLAMALVVFVTFRSIVPSSFVILAAVSDLIATLAVINVLEIKMTTAGIAALLMLIGYSVDTDILLTTVVLKRKGEGGSVSERVRSAMRTGITMTLTAVSAALVAAIFAEAETIRQIMTIVLIGLVFDLIFTWFQNAGILRWYVESKHGKA